MEREWWSSGFFDMEMAKVLFSAERMKQAKEEVAQLIKMASLKKGQQVLDAACGVGRHSLEFANKGISATGVDISEEYVLEARRRLHALAGCLAQFPKQGHNKMVSYVEQSKEVSCCQTYF